MILVTGGLGTIGSKLINKLFDKGYQVVPFDLKDGKDIRNYQELEDTFYENDIDTVFHLAAVVSRVYSEEHPLKTIETNVIGTWNLIQLCRKYKARLINTSTSEIYNLTNCYGISKYQAEQYVKHYVENYDLKAVTVRPFMCYGKEKPSYYRSAVSNFIECITHDLPIHVHIGAKRSWCYIDDMVEAFITIMEKADFNKYETYDLGVNDQRSMSEVAKIICKLAGKPTGLIQYNEMGKFQTLVKDGDFRKLKKLGFKAKVSLEEGLKRTIEWQRG